MNPTDDSSSIPSTDEVMAIWSQGDYVVADLPFISLIRSGPAADGDAHLILAEGIRIDLSTVKGLVVLTQTCDIRRSSRDRPWLEFAPLVAPASPQVLREIESAKRPRYAWMPKLQSDGLVADLDLVMAVHKSVAAAWKASPGCGTDAERRAFRDALARKRLRWAFPDQFVQAFRPLGNRLPKQHDKNTLEGRLLQNLREIRVAAAPCWSDPNATFVLFFVWPVALDRELLSAIRSQTEKWQRLIATQDQDAFSIVATTLEELSASDYVESVPLDYDHLSASG